MKRHRFVILDVFTDRAFGGNQLAVLPDAHGLSTGQMQAVAREFNFAESTFVLPPADASHTRQVRIFTPALEMPFAGHPNVGTAIALAAIGEVPPPADGALQTLRFEEIAGVVPVVVEYEAGTPVRAELTAPRAPELGATFDPAAVAAALSLAPDDVVTAHHPPRTASSGAPFACIEVAGLDALGRAAPVPGRAAGAFPRGAVVGALLYTRETGEAGVDLRVRMFAPEAGVPEDPATGSAAVALAGLLASLDARTDGELRWTIAQGIEMGRPSRLEATAVKRAGATVETRVRGAAVLVAEGTIRVPDVP